MKALVKEDARIQADLKKLEQQIYALETNYLESTSQAGNLVRGWGDLLTTNQKNQKKKRVTVADEDRIFSLSSATSGQVPRSLPSVHSPCSSSPSCVVLGMMYSPLSEHGGLSQTE